MCVVISGLINNRRASNQRVLAHPPEPQPTAPHGIVSKSGCRSYRRERVGGGGGHWRGPESVCYNLEWHCFKGKVIFEREISRFQFFVVFPLFLPSTFMINCSMESADTGHSVRLRLFQFHALSLSLLTRSSHFSFLFPHPFFISISRKMIYSDF